MRILDIGVATSYALICLVLVSVMNPYALAVQDGSRAADVRASDAVINYVEDVGLVFLANASQAQFCASLQMHSNSTLVLGGAIGGDACHDAPVSFEGTSSLNLSLSGRQEVIEGWVSPESS